jgi:hypothetical protein
MSAPNGRETKSVTIRRHHFSLIREIRASIRYGHFVVFVVSWSNLAILQVEKTAWTQVVNDKTKSFHWRGARGDETTPNIWQSGQWF